MRPLASLLTLLAVAPVVHGDGGLLRVSQRVGDRIVSVFTSPTPPTTGPLDVSVLVQDADSRRVLSDRPVTVRARRGSRSLESVATREAATNKLLVAAALEIDEPGTWTIEVDIGDDAMSSFPIDIAEADHATTWWIAWPFAVIAAFAVARFRRRTSPRGNMM